MAGKRVYATIPQRDARLIERLAMEDGECIGVWARRILLSTLYEELRWNPSLRDYDAALAAEEREQVMRHGR